MDEKYADIERLRSEVESWKWAAAVHGRDSANKTDTIKEQAKFINKLKDEISELKARLS